MTDRTDDLETEALAVLDRARRFAASPEQRAEDALTVAAGLLEDVLELQRRLSDGVRHASARADGSALRTMRAVIAHLVDAFEALSAGLATLPGRVGLAVDETAADDRLGPGAGPPPAQTLRARLAVFERVQSRFRHAVILERADEAMRRTLGREQLDRPMATDGEARRLRLVLEREMADLHAEIRGRATAAFPGRDPDDAVRALAREAGDDERARELGIAGWTDPWRRGELGLPSPFDPRPPQDGEGA